MPKMSSDELRQNLDGFDIDPERTLLVTYHPETNDYASTPAQRFEALLQALDRFPNCNVILTGTNNDAGAEGIRSLAAEYAAANDGRVLTVESLGARRYLSAMARCAAVVGNSSSGIIEAPSMHIPTVDIGGRQAGRLAAQLDHLLRVAGSEGRAPVRSLPHSGGRRRGVQVHDDRGERGRACDGHRV